MTRSLGRERFALVVVVRASSSITGRGTARHRVCLNGDLFPVVHLQADARAEQVAARPSKKRSAEPSAARTACPRLVT